MARCSASVMPEVTKSCGAPASSMVAMAPRRAPVPGATGWSYTPTSADAGKRIKVAVIYKAYQVIGSVATLLSERRVGSAATAMVEPAMLPSEPQNLRAIAGDGVVVLRWDYPASTGYEPIERYEYRYAEGTSVPESTNWNSEPNFLWQRGAKVIGLTNDRTYVFQVRAVNREGGSDPAMVTVTPRPIPCSAPDLAGRTQIWTATITLDGGALGTDRRRGRAWAGASRPGTAPGA